MPQVTMRTMAMSPQVGVELGVEIEVLGAVGTSVSPTWAKVN